MVAVRCASAQRTLLIVLRSLRVAPGALCIRAGLHCAPRTAHCALTRFARLTNGSARFPALGPRLVVFVVQNTMIITRASRRARATAHNALRTAH
eukprot:7223050-Lingulodinium_polyedra.AAC.1